MIVIHFHEHSGSYKIVSALLNWAKHCPFEFVYAGKPSENPNFTGFERIAVFDTGGPNEVHAFMYASGLADLVY